MLEMIYMSELEPYSNFDVIDPNLINFIRC